MKSIFFRKIFPVKKLPGRKGVKYAHPEGLKNLVWKAGRKTEEVTFKRILKRHPGSSVRAYKVAQQKGLRKVQSLGKRLGVEGLGASKSIKTIKRFKPSRIRPRHTRGKDFPDLADDTTIGGVKAYADMPSIKRQLSREAKELKKSWGFGELSKPKALYIKGKKSKKGQYSLHRVKFFD